MSAKIEQIVEVLEKVRENFRSRGEHASITQLRINAVHSIAAYRSIDYKSVLDKPIRQLRPEVKTANDFDRLIETWLTNNSDQLRSIVLRHANEKSDKVLIEQVFYKASDQEILLSEEFGLEPTQELFKEGKEKLQLHLTKERSRTLVSVAKAKWQKEHNGDILCFICSFSFHNTYGEIGYGFIEAHHINPIASLTADTIVQLKDLIPVCSNCHSILHRYRPWLSSAELRDKINLKK